MNYYELTEYLEIEDGSQLQYFEEIADLIESDEHIEHEALQTLFSEVDRDITASLLDDYFNDITGGLPEEHSEMFSLLDQIRMELTGIIRNISEDDPEPYNADVNRGWVTNRSVCTSSGQFGWRNFQRIHPKRPGRDCNCKGRKDQRRGVCI